MNQESNPKRKVFGGSEPEVEDGETMSTAWSTSGWTKLSMNLDQANEVHQVDHRRDGMKDGHQHPRNEANSKQKNRNIILLKRGLRIEWKI